jgi:predicted PhzF superfamily epimerase YddE/YHI9
MPGVGWTRPPGWCGPEGSGPGDNIAEDEATGAAALLLSHRVGRLLRVRQGHGSEIRTELGAHGLVAVGGRVRDAER